MSTLNNITFAATAGIACLAGNLGANPKTLVRLASTAGVAAAAGTAIALLKKAFTQQPQVVVQEVEKVVKVEDTAKLAELQAKLDAATSRADSAEGVLSAQAQREKNLGIITKQLGTVKAALRVTKAVRERALQVQAARSAGEVVSNEALRNLHKPLQALQMLDTARADLEAAQKALAAEKDSAKKMPLELVVAQKHEILAQAIAHVEKNKDITDRFTIGADGKYFLRTDNAKKRDGVILSGAMVVEPGKPKRKKFLGII